MLYILYFIPWHTLMNFVSDWGELCSLRTLRSARQKTSSQRTGPGQSPPTLPGRGIWQSPCLWRSHVLPNQKNSKFSQADVSVYRSFLGWNRRARAPHHMQRGERSLALHRDRWCRTPEKLDMSQGASTRLKVSQLRKLRDCMNLRTIHP